MLTFVALQDQNTAETASNATARDGIVSVVRRFRVIQILEVRTPSEC